MLIQRQPQPRSTHQLVHISVVVVVWRNQKKRSKRKRVKNFFSKVFHRKLSGRGGQEGSGSLLVNSNSTDAKVTADSDGSSFPNPLLRDVGGLTTSCSMKGAGAALQTRRGSSVRDIYLGG